MARRPSKARRKLNVCFVASEAVPFAKTGGLADVAGALPPFLAGRGHDVRVFMPLYGQIDREAHGLVPVDFLQEVPVPVGRRMVRFSGWVGRLPGDGPDVLFVDCPELYHRPSLYTGDPDEHLRFALLSRAALECCQRMAFAPDVVHANDWHTALLPLYLGSVYSWDSLFERTRTVLTIHNIAYQGIFEAAVVDGIGLADDAWRLHQDDLERGVVNFLKTGVLYADMITTVSRTYAEEIKTAAYGEGLEELLVKRGEGVMGIVNGVDYSAWDPSTDVHLARRYGPGDVGEGKLYNKRALCRELGLEPADAGVALLGIVSRLVEQKGFELVFEPLARALGENDLRLAVLGTGEERFEQGFHRLQASFPGKAAFYRGYSEPLAHRIEAAADVFLMPSRFEPCGLNQMYSLKYGTAPLVRKTGGLADTVEHFDPGAGTGTGFVFEHYDATGFAWALDQALAAWSDPDAWARLRRNGMAQDFSWQRQGALYESLYTRLTAAKSS